jgi:hypothetical protein
MFETLLMNLRFLKFVILLNYQQFHLNPPFR